MDVTLTDCLTSFTQTEELESDGKQCSHCQGAHKRTKQLSIATLPVVLVLQIKRFAKTLLPSAKGGGTTISSRKLDQVRPSRPRAPFSAAEWCRRGQHVNFPASSLDLRPFTASELLRRRAGAEGGQGRARRVACVLQPGYTLFALVVHLGTLERGHYVSYVKGYGACWPRAALCPDLRAAS